MGASRKRASKPLLRRTASTRIAVASSLHPALRRLFLRRGADGGRVLFLTHPTLAAHAPAGWRGARAGPELFATASDRAGVGPDVKALHAKIGQLVLENDFLAGALGRCPDASAKR